MVFLILKRKKKKENVDRFTSIKYKTWDNEKKSNLSLKKGTQQIGGDICIYYETGFNEYLCY